MILFRIVRYSVAKMYVSYSSGRTNGSNFSQVVVGLSCHMISTSYWQALRKASTEVVANEHLGPFFFPKCQDMVEQLLQCYRKRQAVGFPPGDHVSLKNLPLYHLTLPTRDRRWEDALISHQTSMDPRQSLYVTLILRNSSF